MVIHTTRIKIREVFTENIQTYSQEDKDQTILKSSFYLQLKTVYLKDIDNSTIK